MKACRGSMANVKQIWERAGVCHGGRRLEKAGGLGVSSTQADGRTVPDWEQHDPAQRDQT